MKTKLMLVSLLILMVMACQLSTASTAVPETAAVTDTAVVTEVPTETSIPPTMTKIPTKAPTPTESIVSTTIEPVKGEWVGRVKGHFIFYFTVEEMEKDMWVIRSLWVPKFKTNCLDIIYTSWYERHEDAMMPFTDNEFSWDFQDNDYFRGTIVAPDRIEGTVNWRIVNNANASCAGITADWYAVPK